MTAVVGLAFAATLLIVGDRSQPSALALEVALCLATGTSGRWPVGGGIATGMLLGFLLAVPLEDTRLSLLTVPMVLLVASSRGRWLLVALFAAWYLPILGLIESGSPADLARYVAGLSVWAFALALSVLIGWQTHWLTRARDRLSREQAVALKAQRRAIARNLHDTVAQATTAIVVRAEAGKLRPGVDPELIEDLDYIASVGPHSLRDLRGMLVAMRTDDGAQPAIALRTETVSEMLDKQVSGLTNAGFAVRVLVQADIDAPPESIRYTLNCVISEAATNILRHGRPGSDCAIMIADADDELQIVVRNETGGRSPVPTNQFGLIGLAERVHALGGEVETLAQDRSWVLQVRIPLTEETPPSGTKEEP